MPRVKRGTVRRAKRKKLLTRAKGFYQTKSKLYRAAKEAVDTAGEVRLRRPQEQEARLPPALGRPHQRGGARERADLLAADARAQGGGHHARPQDAGRPGRHPARGVRQGGRAGQGRAAPAAARFAMRMLNAHARVGLEPRALACDMSDSAPSTRCARVPRALAAAATERDLKTLNDEFLGRKRGSVTALLKTTRSLPRRARREFGRASTRSRPRSNRRSRTKRAALDVVAAARRRGRRHAAGPSRSRWDASIR